VAVAVLLRVTGEMPVAALRASLVVELLAREAQGLMEFLYITLSPLLVEVVAVRLAQHL